MFFTCVALHNMVHLWDGRGEWEAGVAWGGVDGLFDDDPQGHEHWGRPKVRRADGTWQEVQPGDDFSGMGQVRCPDRVVFQPPGAGDPTQHAPEIDPRRVVELHVESSEGFTALQSKLVTNFKVRSSGAPGVGSVRWLRS